MNLEKLEETKESIRKFHMPRYDNLTHINLYMEQVIDEVVLILKPLFGDNKDKWITSTMVSNYVKMGLIPRPLGKKYTKEHIAYLIYISAAKQCLSIGEIKKLIELQQKSYPMNITYDYFCSEFENLLQYVFGLRDEVPDIGNSQSVEAKLFRSTVVSVCYAIFARKTLDIF